MNPGIPSPVLLWPLSLEEDDLGMGVSGPWASRDSVVMMVDEIGDVEARPEAADTDPVAEPDDVDNRPITPDNRFEKLGVVALVTG